MWYQCGTWYQCGASVVPDAARVLLAAGTHPGSALSARPQVERAWRGPESFARFELALAPAPRGVSVAAGWLPCGRDGRVARAAGQG